MKKVILASIIVFSATMIIAGNWKPYVKQGNVTPATLLARQLNGNGVVSFMVGNMGSDPLELVANQEMRVVLTLSFGVPDVMPLDATTALTVIGGTGAGWFTWSYNKLTNSYTGIQSRTIPAQSEGTVTIGYKVTMNSSKDVPANGFNVNLTPPGYTNGANTTSDDAVSFYTFTRAGDFGDAPASYGSADHSIDIDNAANTVWLGTTVDYEPVDQASPVANNDDKTGLDDEDGVIFPDLLPDASVNLPVFVTTAGDNQGFISAWIDWDGNGQFNNWGEQVAKNIPVTGTGTVSLPVTVPGYAITKVPTFARFRIGPENMNSTGSYAFGEVEDYQVKILNPFIGIEEKEGSPRMIIYSYEDDIYVKDLTGRELKGKMLVYNLVGQRIARKALTGGTLNKFSMNVEQGYYVVDIVDDEGTVHGKVFLTR